MLAGRSYRAGSGHTGFNSLLSARKGEAEDAHGAGLEKGRELRGNSS